jgi:hypothetical protein
MTEQYLAGDEQVPWHEFSKTGLAAALAMSPYHRSY